MIGRRATGSDRHSVVADDHPTSMKPYACGFCEKSFYLKGDYTRHIRVHTGETPYKCRYCGRGFKQKGAMVRHEFLHLE